MTIESNQPIENLSKEECSTECKCQKIRKEPLVYIENIIIAINPSLLTHKNDLGVNGLSDLFELISKENASHLHKAGETLSKKEESQSAKPRGRPRKTIEKPEKSQSVPESESDKNGLLKIV